MVKHAAVWEVCVRLMAAPPHCLEIQDNGVGFDPGTVPDDWYGLTGMTERAELVGAQLTVESESRGGTTVQMEIGD